MIDIYRKESNESSNTTSLFHGRDELTGEGEVICKCFMSMIQNIKVWLMFCTQT